jgi:holliday junction DNA helicase RuvA
MISSLTGTLRLKSPTEVVIDVHGVGYAVSIPLLTFEKLPAVGAVTTLQTYLHVREDTLHLFGFATVEERETFRLLLSVSGIGPKMAQGVLSGMSVADVHACIAQGNIQALTAIPGIGRKTAERLVFELKEKIVRSGLTDPDAAASATSAEVRSEAMLALTSLGYPRQGAEKAIRSVLNEAGNAALSLEELLRRALRHLS